MANQATFDLIAATQPFVRRTAKRLALSDALRVEDLFQTGMVIVCELAPTSSTHDATEFFLRNHCRIRGAMLDSLRGESKARRLDRAIMEGLEPIAEQTDTGDFFAPPEARARHRALISARIIATGLIAVAFISAPQTPEEALVERSTQQHMHALVREAVRTELDEEAWKLVEEIIVKKIPMHIAADARGITKSTVSRRVAASIDILAKKIRREM